MLRSHRSRLGLFHCTPLSHESKRHIRTPLKIIFTDGLLIGFIIITVSTACFANMRAVDVGAEGHHVLMDHATQERIFAFGERKICQSAVELVGAIGEEGNKHTEFISPPKPNFFGKEDVALFQAGILGICAVAALHGCPADAFRNRSCQGADSIPWGLRSEFHARSANQIVDGPLPVFEGGVILCDFAFAVVGVPRVDVDGDDEV